VFVHKIKGSRRQFPIS